MVLKKKRNGNSDNILFIDASKYFTPEKTMNIITDEDIQRIYDAYINRAEIEKFSHVAYMEELERNDYNCNIPRYVDSFKKEESVDIDAQTKIIQKCNLEANEIDKQLSVFLKELGLEG
jgi:type I restriction enzyme M protein